MMSPPNILHSFARKLPAASGKHAAWEGSEYFLDDATVQMLWSTTEMELTQMG